MVAMTARSKRLTGSLCGVSREGRRCSEGFDREQHAIPQQRRSFVPQQQRSVERRVRASLISAARSLAGCGWSPRMPKQTVSSTITR